MAISCKGKGAPWNFILVNGMADDFILQIAEWGTPSVIN